MQRVFFEELRVDW